MGTKRVDGSTADPCGICECGDDDGESSYSCRMVRTLCAIASTAYGGEAWASIGDKTPLLYDLCAKKPLVRGWVGIYTDEEEGFRKDLKPPREAMKERGRNLARLQHSGL